MVFSFSDYARLIIPEGEVRQITDDSGQVIWKRGYINQVPLSTDTDGSIFNGVGYKDNTRLSSSGGVSGSAQNGSVTTGFIPCAPYDVIRLKGVIWLGTGTEMGLGHYYFNFYDKDKKFLCGFGEGSYKGNYDRVASIVYDASSGVTTFQHTSHDNAYLYVSDLQSAVYFRVNAYGKGKDMIVTVNEEIN